MMHLAPSLNLKPFLQRVAITLCTGYIIVFYGELVFWATPEREGMDISGIIAVWLSYSIMAYPFLWVVSYFKVRDPWAMFLAGAFFGWFVEGIVVQTMYGLPDTPFPMSISFTGLAWHAPLDIYVGWYLVRRVLVQNKPLKTLALSTGIGLFFGLWAIFWWNEPSESMKVLLDSGQKDVLFIHFVFFAFGMTALLVFAYALYQRVRITEFKPSKFERWGFSLLVLLYYIFVTVPAAPASLWVLPPLMGATCWALYKNRNMELSPDAIVGFPGKIKILNYMLLLVMPLMASVIYFLALANDLRLSTNLLVYYITTPLGAILWIISVVVCSTRKGIRESK